MNVTVSREQALAAAAALRQAGDTATASVFERASVQLWVLSGVGDDGYNAYLGFNRHTVKFYGETAYWGLGGASDAELFTDEAKDGMTDAALALLTGLNVEQLQEQELLDLDWRLAPDEADIADMHENSDPDRVDEYVALVARANQLRAGL